jgi:hypothetical protein
VLGLDREAAGTRAQYLWGSRRGVHAKIPRIRERGGGICSDRVQLRNKLEVGDATNTWARVGDSKRGAGLSAPRERRERPHGLLGWPANAGRGSEFLLSFKSNHSAQKLQCSSMYAQACS